ncbi:MAG: hypothetical protein R2745_14805 [Vicinamibacterales bacterium]
MRLLAAALVPAAASAAVTATLACGAPATGAPAAPPAAGQAPDAAGVYHTQFENDWVRLVRVRYPGRTKLPVHGHPTTVTTYVYLSESSPVRFTHQGTRTHVVTRQPTTPGGFRVSRGGDETHAVENLGPTASDFLRVEFKTDPAGDRSPYYRDNRILAAGAEPVSDVRFTNRQMRITRIAIPPGASTEVATTADAPALLIALGQASLAVNGAARTFGAGQERWMPVNQRDRLENSGQAPAGLLRIDLLTPPRQAGAR